MGVETLYHYCEIARELTMRPEWMVGRVMRVRIPEVSKGIQTHQQPSRLCIEAVWENSAGCAEGSRTGCNQHWKNQGYF